MSSKVPSILDALETRLETVAPVYRCLQGRGLPASVLDDLPIIAMRLTSDRIEGYLGSKTKVELSVTIEIVAVATNEKPDNVLAGLLWSTRKALKADDEIPLNGLLRSMVGIEWDPAIFDVPESGETVVRVRQPLRLKLTEIYA